MNHDINPYASPIHSSASLADGSASNVTRRFLGRSIVVGMLAVATLGTSLLLLWLGSTGAVDLGQLGGVALGSLLFATIALFVSVRYYSLGSRKFAVAFLLVAMLFFVPIVMIALHEAGM